MKIADVMTPDLDTVSPGDTLKTAARLMADLDSGALPVGEENRLIGTITGHDIAMQVAAEGMDPGETTVGQAMSSDVLYCFESESVEEVSEKMRGWWVRRLPVVSGDKRLIGVVSLGDLTSLKGQPRTKPTPRRAPGRSTRRAAAAA
jgi:CBS domain-containing protein